MCNILCVFTSIFREADGVFLLRGTLLPWDKKDGYLIIANLWYDELVSNSGVGLKTTIRLKRILHKKRFAPTLEFATSFFIRICSIKYRIKEAVAIGILIATKMIIKEEDCTEPQRVFIKDGWLFANWVKHRIRPGYVITRSTGGWLRFKATSKILEELVLVKENSLA